jgi:hypothetical protein
MEVKVLKEAKEVKDKTLPVHSRAGEFSGPLLPLLPQLRSLPLLRRKFLAKWLAGSLVTLGATLVFSPIAFAQTDTQAGKASETAKSQDAPPLSPMIYLEFGCSIETATCQELPA